MRNFGSFVIADHGRESCDQHERLLDVLIDLLQIGLGTLDEKLAEVGAAVRHDRDRVSDIEDHQRLVNVHFEIAARTAETYRDVVCITCKAIMVSASHCVGLTLPGMIYDPGSFSGILSSAKPARGPHDIRRMSLAIL